MSNKNKIYDFFNNEQKQKEYNDEIVNKTWHYQKKFGFKTSTQKGHEFWNNEADAFKHAYSGADMYLKYGNSFSLGAGIYHEYQTPNNPPREWNMDSWNNHQGREIAREILKEYGNNFFNLPQQQQDDIKAVKVMDRMRNGQIITNPTDTRDYKGRIENYMKNHPEIIKQTEKLFGVNQTTGQAANFDINQLANMLGIQLPDVQSTNQPKQDSGLFGYTNPLTGSNHIYTREEVGSMTPNEFAKHEKEIDAQIRAFNGTMPTNGDLQREAMTGGGVVYVNSYTRSDGTEVKGYYRSKPRF